jgi:hypothetical protein
LILLFKYGIPELLLTDFAGGWQWVRWPRKVDGNDDPKTFAKYAGWVGGMETLAWKELQQQCSDGA